MSIQEIHFVPGTTSATVKGSLYQGMDTYTVFGRSGQFLDVAISPPFNARFVLSHSPVDPSGAEAPGDLVPMCEMGALLAKWAGNFPINGTVAIDVGAGHFIGDYVLSVSITD